MHFKLGVAEDYIWTMLNLTCYSLFLCQMTDLGASMHSSQDVNNHKHGDESPLDSGFNILAVIMVHKNVWAQNIPWHT